MSKDYKLNLTHREMKILLSSVIQRGESIVLCVRDSEDPYVSEHRELRDKIRATIDGDCVVDFKESRGEN